MPSTAIRQFSYDDLSRTLFVTFVSGDLYAYRGVEREVFAGLRAASSKGRYFSRRIRDRYPFVRMNPSPPRQTAARAPPG